MEKAMEKAAEEKDASSEKKPEMSEKEKKLKAFIEDMKKELTKLTQPKVDTYEEATTTDADGHKYDEAKFNALWADIVQQSNGLLGGKIGKDGMKGSCTITLTQKTNMKLTKFSMMAKGKDISVLHQVTSKKGFVTATFDLVVCSK